MQKISRSDESKIIESILKQADDEDDAPDTKQTKLHFKESLNKFKKNVKNNTLTVFNMGSLYTQDEMIVVCLAKDGQVLSYFQEGNDKKISKTLENISSQIEKTFKKLFDNYISEYEDYGAQNEYPDATIDCTVDTIPINPKLTIQDHFKKGHWDENVQWHEGLDVIDKNDLKQLQDLLDTGKTK